MFVPFTICRASFLFPENPLADTISEKPSMLVCSVGGILHDANVHRLTDRYSNRLSCFVINEARRTFEERITRCLVHIELAEWFQGVVTATLYLDGKLKAPAPRQPYSSLGRPEVAVGEVVQVDPGAVGEAQRGPLPGL